MTGHASICVAVLAHNEEKRIGSCLTALLAEPGDFPVHVIVNGSSDRTADVARAHGPRVTVHEYAEGGKSRSWSRFALDELDSVADVHVFVDGDAVIAPGSLAALARTLAADPSRNAASAIPMNGRKSAAYVAEMLKSHGLFGALYALSGDFLRRMRSAAIRLPDDLIGDDGLLCAMAKTDLGDESQWQDARVAVCTDAGFFCELVSMARPSSWRMQYRRMGSYARRRFQNRIISDIMKNQGPAALPRRLATLYSRYLDDFAPRGSLPDGWFDRIALSRMRAEAQAVQASAE